MQEIALTLSQIAEMENRTIVGNAALFFCAFFPEVDSAFGLCQKSFQISEKLATKERVFRGSKIRDGLLDLFLQCREVAWHATHVGGLNANQVRGY
jgi:hypothetical protein